MSIAQMTAAATRWDLLKHSFYRRWTAGELTVAEIQDYACQYNFVVGAMPGWLAAAAVTDAAHAAMLQQHSREEAGHVTMWADFAAATGVAADKLTQATPNAATRKLLALGDDLVARGMGAAAVWALEVQTPGVSVEKLAGLGQYGIEPGPGTRYFQVHQSMDIRHTAELEAIVQGGGEATVAGAAADAMSAALWDILTSVEAEVALA